jgi:hypothetical protein
MFFFYLPSKQESLSKQAALCEFAGNTAHTSGQCELLYFFMLSQNGVLPNWVWKVLKVSWKL